jgi:hypothetical protein
MKKLLIIAAFAAMSSQAAFVTQTLGTGALADTPLNLNLNFQGFQTLVGAGFTLTGVTVTLEGEMTGTGSVTNTGTGPATATWSYVNGSGFTDLLISVAGNPMVNLVPLPGFTNLQALNPNAGQTLNFSNRNYTDTQNTGLLASGAIFDAFNVAGAIPVNFTANAFVQTGCSNGNCNFALVTQARGVITVRYDYEPTQNGDIPEPSTLAMLGSALVGLGLIARRRKA